MEARSVVEMVCLHCARTFEAAHPWDTALCSEECSQARRREQNRKRDRIREKLPERILASRERNRRWCEVHRACKATNPWLAGPPPFASHLPGVTMSIAIEPRLKWPIALRNTRALHGALTTILDVGHLPRFPLFSLRQTDLSPSGWAVHWWHEVGSSFASKEIAGRLFDRAATFTFGPAVRIRSPAIKRRGRRQLRVDTVTPVCVVNTGRATQYTRPTAANLIGTLAGEQLSRYGLEYLKREHLVRIEVVETTREQEAQVELGSKYGVVHGWEGSLVVIANAPGHWLLETAARVGFGSRTAFGLGQIRVSEVTT